MTACALIAHGGPQRLPTRAAPSLVRALRDARGSPPWTPWTILCRLDRHHPSYATCIRVDGANRCDPHADPIGRVRGVITITGIGDHLRPEWPITITGTRSRNGLFDVHQAKRPILVEIFTDAQQHGNAQTAERATSFDPVGGIKQLDTRVVIPAVQ